ncbi:hypothetical protein D9619_002239 [Psilocybe cf. subviscida]|uniref:Nephrocystin 3-like N-terminal domain-containing protein n=1 Tax=Psilocybe cf. subviscida TaxID=2480587 RepID=A0A8H5F2D5_9AGAR|nr:hypothetical protein D9619_002239 [Psilocybe cf. subviscida]
MSIFQGASNVSVLGGTFVATNTIQNSHISFGTMIHNDSASSLSSAYEKLSVVAAHAALHDSAARFNPPRCHRNTRERLLTRLELWIRREAEQTMSLIWLHGGAGAGKSAIMQSIVERCESDRLILGTFFFNRSDESRNNAEAFIPTLAYQVLRARSSTRWMFLGRSSITIRLYSRRLFKDKLWTSLFAHCNISKKSAT